MLTFLAPAALVGLSLLAIPIIIHLLKPRKVRRTPFSSLRWLHLTQQRLSRRLRWHQLLLFFLRAAFITLLVLAIAKPIFDRQATSGPSERFVILDVSRSMGYQTVDKPSPLEVGKQAAASLLAGGGANDRTALLTVGATTKILGAPTRGGELHAPKLSPLTAESSDTDLGTSLDAVRTLLARRRPDAKIELFLVTDGHRGSWRTGAVESFVAEFPDTVTATIVNVAEPAAQNGWIADARFLAAEPGEPPVIDVQLRAVGAGTERTVRLTGAAGLNERSQTIVLDPERPTDVRFELPADFDPRGKTCEVVLDPPDALPSDDRWYLTFDGGTALDVLIVEGRGAASGGASPGFALQTAVAALSSPTAPIRATTKKFNEVDPAEFAGADVVLLADVPELSDVVLEALTDRVRRGLGLGLFLGPGVDADFYNRRFIDPLERSKSLLPLRLDRVTDVPQSDGGLAPLESVAWNHPLLAGLFDPALGDLAQARVRSYYRFAAPPDDATTVLASVAGSPAIVERSVGRGKVVLFNTGADDAWSDLPRRKSFVPLVDRLLNYLSGGATQRSFTTGEAIAVSLPPLAGGESLWVAAPDDTLRTPSLAGVGNGTRLSLPPQTTPGVYRIRRTGTTAGEAEGSETTFVVQVGRGDSAIAPLDADVVRSWWQPAKCEITTASAIDVAAGNHATSLVAWATALAALLLAVETLLVHRLCPRMNPQVAESVMQRKPIVSPSNRTGFGTLAPLNDSV